MLNAFSIALLVTNSAKLIQPLVDPNSIIKLKTKPNKISYSMKKMFAPLVLIVLYLSVMYHNNTVISSIWAYAESEINSSRLLLLFLPKNGVGQETQEKSPYVQLIAVDNSTTSKNNIMNKTSTDVNKTISDQYIITLKDEVTRTPKGLQDALDNLTAKVQSEGAKVIYVYKYSTKGLAIKVPSQEILEKLLDDLRRDPRVAAIEPDKTVQAF